MSDDAEHPNIGRARRGLALLNNAARREEAETFLEATEEAIRAYAAPATPAKKPRNFRYKVPARPPIERSREDRKGFHRFRMMDKRLTREGR